MTLTRLVWAAALGCLLGLWVTLAGAQGPVTRGGNLRVVTDANGYLVTSIAAYTGPDGPLTPLANIGVRTDSNGYLLTALNGAAVFAAGSAASPSINFGGDDGFYSVSGNAIGVSVDGAVRQYFEGSGTNYQFTLASGVLKFNGLGDAAGTWISQSSAGVLDIESNAGLSTLGLLRSNLQADYFASTSRPTTTVDGATTFAVTTSYLVLACTGAETINTITGGVTGQIVLIENTDTDCTIADDDDATASNAVDLTGTATNDVGAVAKVITLIYNGTYWLQTAESDN